MTILHYKNVKMQNIPKVNELEVEMTIFVNLYIRSVIVEVITCDLKYHMALSTIFSVTSLQGWPWPSPNFFHS